MIPVMGCFSSARRGRETRRLYAVLDTHYTGPHAPTHLDLTHDFDKFRNPVNCTHAGLILRHVDELSAANLDELSAMEQTMGGVVLRLRALTHDSK